VVLTSPGPLSAILLLARIISCSARCVAAMVNWRTGELVGKELAVCVRTARVQQAKSPSRGEPDREVSCVVVACLQSVCCSDLHTSGVRRGRRGDSAVGSSATIQQLPTQVGTCRANAMGLSVS
jgi:hypothetical protein